jgi:sec-independent protein translocase protein TatC
MAEPSADIRPEEEEDGGGPVKTFLEHLEDLRWVLIKSGAAILVAMVVCLLGVNQLVVVLKWPLVRARALQAHGTRTVAVYFGDIKVTTFHTRTNRIGALDLGNQPIVALQVEPVSPATGPEGLADGELPAALKSGVAPGAGAGRQLLWIHQATNLVMGEVAGRGPDLIFLDPAAPFISSLHLALFGGLIIAAPLVFYFVGQFVVPAMKIKEKKYFLRAFGIGVGLFLVGVCFCYFALMPFALRAAEVYSLWMGVAMPEWRAETYFNFVTKFMLGMGLGFELPVVLLALVKVGILDYRKLSAMRRYMIVVNLILGALLTTPEVFTQVLMAVPLQILYECAVWIAWYWERQEKKRARLAASTAQPA